MSSQGIRWFAGTVGVGTGDGFEIAASHRLSDAQHDRVLAAMELLLSSTLNHRVTDLRRAAKEFYREAALWSGDSETNPPSQHDLQHAMTDWLTNLRAFDDQTMHALSKRYGKESAECAVFKAACSAEYDRVFAYRFAYRLRNYAQHVGRPIQHSSTRSSDDPADTRVIGEIHFDSDYLLWEYDAWAVVRDELAAIGGRFPVVPVVESVMKSSDRILAASLLSQEQQLLEAAQVLADVISSVDPTAGQPTLLGLPPEDLMPADVNMFQLQFVELDPRLPPMVRRALASSAALLAAPPHLS